MSIQKTEVLIAQLWDSSNDSCQFMGVAKDEESMNAWVRTQWGNPVPYTANPDGTGSIAGYELLGPDGEDLGFALIIETEEVH